MKTQRIRMFGSAVLVAPLIATLSTSVDAQLTWEPVDIDGFGDWDLVTDNWDSGGDTYVVWDGTGATEAVFPDFGADYTVTVADSGVTVGDLSYAGGAKMVLEAATDNVGRITIKSGGATWNTGGGEIEFNNFNDGTLNDLGLTIANGDTLTVTGGGIFDTGESPNGANWSATGATLDVVSVMAVRGDVNTTGKFTAVKLLGGSSFTYGRNSNGNIFANNWELGAGEVSFDSTYNRIYNLDGVISGAGRFVASDNNDQVIRLRNVGNTFTGGLRVEEDGRVFLDDGDVNLGPTVGGTLDVENIILRDGGVLQVRGGGSGTPLDANRGITLEGTGGVIGTISGAVTINGPIAGVGGLSLLNDSAFTFAGSGSDYTGTTSIGRGSITAGAENALGASVLILGGTGGGTSFFEMDGFATTLGGLNSIGSNTREVRNNGADTTLTLDVADGESYATSNLTGTGGIALVKEGLGTQLFTRGVGFSTAPTSLTVNEGTVNWSTGGSGSSGGLTLCVNGTVVGNGIFNGPSVISGALEVSASSGTGTDTMDFNDTLSLDGTATLSLEIVSLLEFDALKNDGEDVFTAGGSLVFDATGYVPMAGDSFQILETWGGFAGSFASISGTDLGGGFTLDTSMLLVDGTVTVMSAGGNAYDTWADGFGLVGGFDDDDSQDGVDNGMAFILGGDPTTSDTAVLPVIGDDSGDMTFTYMRNDDSLGITTQTFQWSTDLVTWNDVDASATETTDPDGDGVVVGVTDGVGSDAIVITVPSGLAVGGRIFGRLTATMP